MKRRFDLGRRLTQTPYNLRGPHSFPNAAFFFPVVERLAVDLVNGCFCDFHAARCSGHEKLNVISCATGSFHIDESDIFAASVSLIANVMNLAQPNPDTFDLVLTKNFSGA